MQRQRTIESDWEQFPVPVLLTMHWIASEDEVWNDYAHYLINDKFRMVRIFFFNDKCEGTFLL